MAQNLANSKATIKHDYVSNMLKGGNQTHCLATLLQMFQTMAQKVRDTESGGCKTGSATVVPAVGLLAPSQRYSTIEEEEACQL